MGKQEQYLNRVLERIIGETKYDVDNNVISPIMFSINWYVIKNPEFKYNLPAAFIEHCKNVYGLSKEEMETVWYDYKAYIRNNHNKINENVDKQKNFYDKVLERLLKETVITDSKITFPFAIFKQPELTGDSLLSVSQWIDGRWENHKYPHRFHKYVNDIYGITYMESLGLWNSYMDIIEEEVSKRLKRPSSDIRVATTWNMGRHDINESMDTHHLKYFVKDLNDKQKNYLNKVIEHLVNNTEMDYQLRRIHYPFKDSHTGRDETYSFSYIYPFSGPFIRYCNNLFPLSEDEMKYVHGMYIANIYNKVSDYFIENDLYHLHYNVNGTKDIITFDQ